MKKILLSAFALAAMTSVAMAEPVKMTDAQMDAVTAGRVQVNNATVIQTNVCTNCAFVDQVNWAEVKQTNIKFDRGKDRHKFKRPPRKKVR